VQRRLVGADAGVAADQVQLRHRHVQRGLVGVFQVQELAGAFAQVDVQQPLVAADAVVDVHHRVADLQLRQVLDQRVDAADLLLLAAAARLRRGGEELGLGDELHASAAAGLVPVEASASGAAAMATFSSPARNSASVATPARDAVVAQQLQQALAAAVALGHQQHAVRRGRRCCSSGAAARWRRGRRQVGQRARPVHGSLPRSASVACACVQREELLGRQEHLLRRQDRPLGVVLQEAVALARVGPEALQRLVDLAVQHQRGVRSPR
jgi:hypothetical protein